METILLVEGEAEIADMAREALEANRYRILNALSAEEAVGVRWPIPSLFTCW